MNIKSNKGIVKISRQLLDDYIEKFDDENPLFRDFVPAKIDYDYLTDTMSIYGYSKHFRPIFEGEIIPAYEALVSTRTSTINKTVARFHEIQNPR